MDSVKFTDVLVCGAGPVGQVIALGLAQQNIDTIIIEQKELHEQEHYGRASTLFPRTLELLENLDVTGDMIQAGFVARASAGFRDGKRVSARGWHQIFPALATSFHDYILNIRQNNSQRIFSGRYEADFGKSIMYGWEITNLKIDSTPGDRYNVTVHISHISQGTRIVRCKYLVGADGGHSTVRRLAGVDMEGDKTTHKWIRIDAKMKTDIPEPNIGFASIETQDYGNVLWVKLDRDAHRIGFALTPSLQAKYPNGPTKEEALEEAVKSIRPFKLEIERLDWWTVYSIKQKVAKTMQKDQYVLLAGDAAHTHSSGFAQGMNTGIHDATNLTWKLAGTLKGWYKPGVLSTYNTERHATAKKLIAIDKLVADTISGKIPPEYMSAGGNADEALSTVLQTNMSFTVGLGVTYAASIIGAEPTVSSIVPGSRSPDALVHHPGPSVPIRLHTITHKDNKGRWSLIVFGGSHILNGKKVAALREIISGDGALQQWRNRINTSTLIIGTVGSAWGVFDGPAIGNLYFDTQGMAHNRYAISDANGGVVIVRPDGVFAFASGLEEWDKIEEFFKFVFV